jgi:VIT1/CCC1 family predicted Fe2+/Mn2+ transporter
MESTSKDVAESIATPGTMTFPMPAVRGVLSPLERASEVLFGLIMALTITGALSVTNATPQETQALFVSTLSCNVAWGLVDAVMYVMNVLFEAGRRSLAIRVLETSSEPARTRGALGEMLPEPFLEGMSAAELDSLRRKILGQPELRLDPRVRGEDLLGALGVFLLVVGSTFPVALPFLVVDDLPLAKAISRGLSLVLLFIGGYAVGRYSGLGPVRVGLAMLGIGAVLVATVTALGG